MTDDVLKRGAGDGSEALRLDDLGSSAGGAALYEVELTRVSAGSWSCYAEPDIAEGVHAYRVYDEDADRDLVEGTWTITPTLDTVA